MSGPAITAYLKRLCQDMDAGRTPRPFRWRRVLAPLAVPAVMGLAAGVGGCAQDEICGDGIDNDRDGMLDCADHDCEDHVGCRATPEYAAPMPEKAPPSPAPEPEGSPSTSPDAGATDGAPASDGSPSDGGATDGAPPPRRAGKLSSQPNKVLRTKSLPRLIRPKVQVLYSAPFD